MADAKLVIQIEDEGPRAAPAPSAPSAAPPMPALPLPAMAGPVGTSTRAMPGAAYPVLPPVAVPKLPPVGPAAAPPPPPAPPTAARVAGATPPGGPPPMMPVAMPPAGAAMSAVLPKLLDPRTLKGAADDVNVGFQRVGRAAEGVADNKAGPALSAAVDTAAAGLSRLGPYGMAAAAGLKAFEAGMSAVGDTMNAFVARGRELAGYNSSLAGATAGADVRSMLADVREAEQIGPKLAELIEQQSKMEAVFRELLLPIKEFVIGQLGDILKGVLLAFAGMLEGINEKLPIEIRALAEVAKKIKDIIEDKVPNGDLLGDLLKQADKFISPDLPAGAKNRPNPAAAPVIGIPIVNAWR